MKRIGFFKAADSLTKSVAFTLPQVTYNDLYVLIGATSTTADNSLKLLVNNDLVSNGKYGNSDIREALASRHVNDGTLFRVPSSNNSAFSDFEGFIPGYRTAGPKHVVYKSAARSENILQTGVFQWNDDAAATSITFEFTGTGFFKQGSTITLYAI